MKKFLVLLITAASCITVSAQNSTAPVSMQTGKLDGKTFNITLVVKQSPDVKVAAMATSKDAANEVVQPVDQKGSMSTTATNSGEPMKDEKSVDPQSAVTAQQDNTAVNNESNADYSMYTQSLNSKTTLSFSNGMLDSPMMTERKLESCPYKVNASEGDMKAFSATCRSVTPPASAIWSGMVTANSIKGSVSYRLGNGQVMDYTFTGTAQITRKTGSKSKSSSSIENRPAGKTE